MRATYKIFWEKKQRKIVPYLYLTPFFFLFLGFMLWPVGFGFYISLTDWVGIRASKIVGLNNYLLLFSDTTVRQALVNTAWYAGASIFLVIPLGLLLAVFLNTSWVKGRNFFRIVYLTPIVTAAVVISLVFTFVYDYRYGILNALFRILGISPQRWLENARLVKPSIIGIIIWRWTGYIMIFFLAGLQNINPELYEAAVMDGANRSQIFLYITIPLLRPVILFVLVIVTVGSFQIFEEPFILTRGGPADTSLSLVQYLYRIGFQYVNLGNGSALGFALFIFIFGLALSQVYGFGTFKE